MYAVAKDTDSYAVFYNKALFDQAGVPYPDDSWTIADFCETAKKMTSDGVVGWTSSTSDRVWYNFIWSNGGQIYSEDGTTAAINTPESAEVIQMLMDLSANGYAYTGPPACRSVRYRGLHLRHRRHDHQRLLDDFQYASALGDNLGIVELPSGAAGKFSANHGIGYSTPPPTSIWRRRLTS